MSSAPAIARCSRVQPILAKAASCPHLPDKPNLAFAGYASKRKITLASRSSGALEQYALYNANHASFIVFDVDLQKLTHVKINDFAYRNFENVVFLEKSKQTGALGLRHRKNGYIFALQKDSVDFESAANSASSDLSIIPTGEREIAILSNGFHLCADRNGAISVSSPWILGWEKFSLVTWQAAFDLAETRLLDPFPPRKNRRAVQITRREKYGDHSLIVNDVRVTATDWSLLRKNRTLLTPNAVHLHRGYRQDVVMHQRPVALRLKKACMIGGYYNYYHHLADYMINIFGVRNWIGQDLPLLTIKAEHEFQKQIATAFDLDRQVVELEHLSCMRVDSLLVPEKAIVKEGIVRNPAIVRSCVEYLQAKFGAPVTRKKRIFISRENALTRRASNEDQAISIAAAFGFEKTILEGMSFADQVRLFSEAEAVIGLHGAGFTNLIFAPSNCLVVEIMPSSDWMPAFFPNLATGLGHRFERLLAKGSFGSTTIEIDTASLRSILHQHLR